MVPKLLLWSFILNLGTVFGAGIYEARISVPRWLGPSPSSGPGWHPDEAKRDDTGRRFWGLTTTGPLTLLTFANLWAGSRFQGPLALWWLTSGFAALADRLFTFSYFIPRMVGLLRSPDSPEARSRMGNWARLNYLRLGFVLFAWVAALQALTLVAV